MFEALDDKQWRVPSLCGDWTVRDIAGHLVMPFLVGMRSLLWGLALNRGDFDRFSSRTSRQIAARPPAELVQLLKANAEHRFTPPGLGPEAPLTDACVHARDVARPLGLPNSAPLATWRVVLDFVTSPAARRFVPRDRLAGLRLTATDQDWSGGGGELVEGASEAVATPASAGTWCCPSCPVTASPYWRIGSADLSAPPAAGPGRAGSSASRRPPAPGGRSRRRPRPPAAR